MGAVSGGYLKVRGSLVPIVIPYVETRDQTTRRLVQAPTILVKDESVEMKIELDMKRDTTDLSAFWLPLELALYETNVVFRGLILESVEDEATKYRRIGVLTPWRHEVKLSEFDSHPLLGKMGTTALGSSGRIEFHRDTSSMQELTII